MFLSKRITVVYALILVVLSGLTISVHGQNEYNGPLHVGKYKGVAEFEYSSIVEDTVFNGDFYMHNANLDSLTTGTDSFFSFKGAFQQNLPQGPWQFHFGKFSIGDQLPDFNNNRYEVIISGKQHMASGVMKEGKPNGTWTHTVSRLENSELKETLFASSINFTNGIPQRNFNIENTDMTLLGRFLRDGLAHDMWELYSNGNPQAVETWHFNEGRLEKILIRANGQVNTIPIYNAPIKRATALTLNDQYIHILKLKQLLAGESMDTLQSFMNDLLEENAAHYQKIDNILSKLGDSAFMPEFKVKVADIPLTATELTQLDSIASYYEKASILSNELLSNTQLKIVKLSNQEAFFLLAAVNEMQKQFLSVIKQVLDYKQQGALGHVNRANLLEALWSGKGEPSLSLDVYLSNDSTNTKAFEGPKVNEYNLPTGGIDAVHQLAMYTWQSIDSVEHILSEKIKRQKRQQELETLEEELVVSLAELDALIDSLHAHVSGQPEQALEEIKATASKALSNYSAIEDLVIKPDRARSLINCFDQMGELSLSVAELPMRWDEIKQAYTEEVWNPFTSTLMNEEEKKRITEAYNKVLTPYLLNQIITELSCKNTPHLNKLIDNAYQRMLEMRDEDTSRMERKLKKEHDPLVVMQLFNIQPNSEIE